MTQRNLAAAWLLVLGIGVLLRVPSLSVPILNEDEAIYAATAAAMATGEPPYRAGVESKPPGMFYIYRAGFALVGRYHMRALHALTIPWVLAAALFVAALARRGVRQRAARSTNTGDPPSDMEVRAPLLAALFYLVFTTVEEPKVLATQCELLYTLPLSASALCLVLSLRRSGARLFLLAFLAGTLCGAGTIIKPTAGTLLGAAMIWLLVGRPLLRGRGLFASSITSSGAAALAMTLGFAAWWLAMMLWFSHLGVWNDLVYWAFEWTLRSYVPTGISSAPFLRRFLFGFVLSWLVLTPALWISAISGLRFALRDRAFRDRADIDVIGLCALWALLAVGATFIGGRFFDHYFPQTIPPLSVLAGIGAARALSTESGTARPRMAWLIGCGVALPALLCFTAASNFYPAMRLLGDPRKSDVAVAAAIAERTRPDERIFVWGYYPLLYVDSDRIPASRFVGCHYLTGYATIGLSQELPEAVEDRLGVPNGFAILVEDLEKYRPALFIDTTAAGFHGWARYPLSRYPLLARYVADHYEKDAEVDGAILYRRR